MKVVGSVTRASSSSRLGCLGCYTEVHPFTMAGKSPLTLSPPPNIYIVVFHCFPASLHTPSRTRHTRQTWSLLYTIQWVHLHRAPAAPVWPLARLGCHSGPTRNAPNTPPRRHAITRHHAIQVTLSSSAPRLAWYLEAASGATQPTKKKPSTRSLSPW